MTSSNRNIFRVTGLLCGEFTGYRWIPRTKASDAELWFPFHLRLKQQLSKRWRRHRVSGIPEPNLQPDQIEDTTSTVVKLANEVLKVVPPLQNSDIEVSHRLKKSRHARDNEPRSIIVRFRSKHERFRVISNRKQLKDYNVTNDSKIFINEDLTAMRAKLFSTVRTLHKKRHFQQVWTYNGTIRVKDLQGLVKVIHNNEDIQNCLPNVDLAAALRNWNSVICVSFVYDLITSELCLWWRHQMETIFRVTGPLCGEFNGDRWNPLAKASDAELWCYHWSVP